MALINLSITSINLKRLKYLKYKLNKPVSKLIEEALKYHTFMKYDELLKEENLGVKIEIGKYE